jgi:hypothetical protein
MDNAVMPSLTLPLFRRMPCPLGLIGLIGLIGVSSLLAACSPTLNWRDVDVGLQTKVQFPCRPEHAERSLVLAGTPMRTEMWVCDAGGLSWSVTVLDVNDPTRLTAVLRESRLSLATRLQGGEESVQRVRIAGMTPNDESRRVVIAGPAGAGKSVRAEAVFAVRGLQVFQLVVMAQREVSLKWAEGADEFLRSVRWPA